MGSKRKGIGRKICLTPKRAALTLLMGAIAIAGALGISAHAATGQATDENLVGKTVYLNSDTKKFKNVKYGAGGRIPRYGNWRFRGSRTRRILFGSRYR